MSLFCYAVICVHCGFAIILLGNKELAVLFNCLLDTMLLLFFSFSSQCCGLVCKVLLLHCLVIFIYFWHIDIP